MSAKVFSFLKEPPKVAYIDPSFFINYLIKQHLLKIFHDVISYKIEPSPPFLFMASMVSSYQVDRFG